MTEKRSAAEWRGLLARQRKSERDEEFAERLGVSVNTVRWWRWHWRQVDVESEAAAGFVEVTTVEDRDMPTNAFEVRLPGGAMILVHAGFDDEELSRLVRTLESTC